MDEANEVTESLKEQQRRAEQDNAQERPEQQQVQPEHANIDEVRQVALQDLA
jgi:hypothetical protein